MVEIYTKNHCPYCDKAKRLLDQKGVRYVEHIIDDNPVLRQKMLALSDGRITVPQIFIHQKGIGGCDDLYALEAAGKLTELLKEEGEGFHGN